MVRSQRLPVAVLGLAVCTLFVGACGSSKHSSSAADSSTTAGKSTTSTSGGPTAILTGLPLSDPSIQNRPLLTVKIDNAPDARPQFGIQNADDIVEEKVEGGISRFMALFQSQNATQLGPVRSLRSTDAHWLKPEGGMIAYSGGIDPFKALLAPNGITDLGGDSHGATYYKRRSDRPYEHSLYVNTDTLRTLTPKNEPAPKAIYQYLSSGQTFGGAGAAPVTSVSLAMGTGAAAEFFDWTWDAKSGKFLRGTDGKAHNIEGVGQIAMENVVVQFTNYSSTPYFDRANTPVDEADTTGQGDAWFLSNGTIVKGHWSRPTDNDITSYTDSTGAPIALQPGQTWMSMVPPGQPTTIR